MPSKSVRENRRRRAAQHQAAQNQAIIDAWQEALDRLHELEKTPGSICYRKDDFGTFTNSVR